MIFNSATFFLFFAIILGLMTVVKNFHGRQYILLVASYIFYGAWNAWFLLLIAGCSIWNWSLGRIIHRSQNKDVRDWSLALSLAGSLGALFYFKYAHFAAQSVNIVAGTTYDLSHIILPVGISFFTFQAMSYTIDVYRKDIPECKSLSQFLLYVAFFPQLVAGPIVRASEFLPQLLTPKPLTRENAIIGLQLFIGGMAQKTLIADNLSIYVDGVFANPGLYNALSLWLGLVAYSIQIFCDFSGYSLMAIGIARILGYTLPKNFDMPYLSSSVTDFWRRWHITLSTWLKDYLYIPLGGNRGGTWFTYRNLLITMVLGGLWHGASWNFVAWGFLHGIALVGHKIYTHYRPNAWLNTRIYAVGAWVVTMLFILFTWLPFRSPDVETTLTYLTGMFGSGGTAWYHIPSLWFMGIFILWHLLHLFQVPLYTQFPTRAITRNLPFLILVAVVLTIFLFAPVDVSPFIYFQF